MNLWKISPAGRYDRDLLPAVRTLLRNGVVVYPTETLYGLGAFPFSEIAIRKVYELKKRSPAKALPLIADSTTSARKITQAWPELVERLAEAFWPGPLTLILPANDELPPEISAGTRCVAVRVSSHPVARHLAARLGGFIIATSANRSGEDPCREIAQLPAALLNRVDGVIDGGATPVGQPSTLLLTPGRSGKLRVLRRGAISMAELERLAGPLEEDGDRVKA